jgi:hypothetical protein
VGQLTCVSPVTAKPSLESLRTCEVSVGWGGAGWGGVGCGEVEMGCMVIWRWCDVMGAALR